MPSSLADRLQGERLAHADGPLRGALDPDDGRHVGQLGLRDADAADVHHLHQLVDHVVDPQAAVGAVGPAVGCHVPHDLAVTEVGRHDHPEHVAVAPGLEPRRLPAVHVARLDPVVRADRDVQLLVHVPVHVAEPQAERPVGVSLPPLERGRDVLSARVEDGLAAGGRQDGQARRRQAEDGRRRHYPPPRSIPCHRSVSLPDSARRHRRLLLVLRGGEGLRHPACRHLPPRTAPRSGRPCAADGRTCRRSSGCPSPSSCAGRRRASCRASCRTRPACAGTVPAGSSGAASSS